MNRNQSKYIDINGLTIRYSEAGEGNTLVLVHGIAGFLEEWEPSMETLCKHYRVIALDLPGHGLSDKPEIPYTLDNLTNFLKDFILAKKLNNIYLAGHSLGGAVCLNFVIKYPTIVRKLITINSAFTKIPFIFKTLSPNFFQKINITVPRCIVKISTRRCFYNKKAITKDWLEYAYQYINKPGTLRTMCSIVHENMTFAGLKKELVNTFLNGLSQIHIPVLIVYSGKDRLVPNENSLILHKLIKNSQSYMVENCGHELQYECCNEFSNIAVQFLGSDGL